MEYIKVTSENIEKEHICCAISNNNDIQVSSKKIFKYLQKKRGCQNGLKMVWFF